MKKAVHLVLLFVFVVVSVLTVAGSAHADDPIIHLHSEQHHEWKKKEWLKLGNRIIILEAKKLIRLKKKWEFETLLRKLAVTRTQDHKIDAFTDAKSLSIHTIKGLKTPLYDAVKSGSFNKRVYLYDVMHNAKLRAEINANYLENVFEVLTPVQKVKFVAILKKVMADKLDDLNDDLGDLKVAIKEKVNKIRTIQNNLK